MNSLAMILSPLILVLTSSAFASVDCSQLQVIRQKMQVISSNIANKDTTHTPAGGPYLRKELVCPSLDTCEVIEFPNTKFKYLPDHPDANGSGYVELPDIKMQQEMTGMMNLQREYETTSQSCN